MADSSIDITAGAGTSVDTRTEGTNGHHRQVIIIGDPATNAGVAPVDATNGLSVEVKGSALTSLQLLDDAIFQDDAGFTPGTSKVLAIGAQADETGTDSVDEGDAGALRMTLDRKLYVAGAYKEDTASADGDPIVVAGFRRAAAPADTSGTDGDYEPLQGSAGALWVAPLGFPVRCSTDITRPADTTAYATNDALSDSTSAPTTGGFTFTSAARKSGGGLLITDLFVMSSNAAGGMQGEIWIFNTAVTAVNDNAAFAISDSEVKTVVAKVPFITIADTNNAAVHVQNLAITAIASGSANLRFLVKLKAAYTPASAEVITVAIAGMQLN